MTPDEKIAMAKRLLIEATQELRRDRQAEIQRARCVCGHRRNRHTVSYSINYTGGFCMAAGCVCKNFMERET